MTFEQASDTAATGAPDTAVVEVPSSTEAVVRTRAARDPAKALNILNGRMPLPLVSLIRFVEPAEAKTSELATRYGTSVGKVFDIRKLANFSYISADYKPSGNELIEAYAWLIDGKTASGQSLADIKGDPDAIKVLLDALVPATEAEVAARDWSTRVAPTTVEGAEPKAPKAKKAKKASTEAPVAEAAQAAVGLF